MKKFIPIPLVMALSMACTGPELDSVEVGEVTVKHYGLERFPDADVYTFRSDVRLGVDQVRAFLPPNTEATFKSWQFVHMVDTSDYYLTQFIVK